MIEGGIKEDSLLNYLNIAFKSKGKSFQDLLDFLEELRILFPYSGKETLIKKFNRKPDYYDIEYSELNRDAEIKSDGGKTAHYRHWIIILHYIYGFTLYELGIDEHHPIFQKIKETGKSQSTSRILALRELENVTIGKAEQDRYFYKIKEFLSSIKSELFVYDYLERHQYQYSKKNNGKTTNEYYFSLHEKIYSKIENLIKNNEQLEAYFTYERFLALPIRYQPHSYIEENTKDLIRTDKDLQREIVWCSSVPLFQHICRILFNYPELQNNNVKSGFYMVEYPSRTSHYAVIDNGANFMVEHYRYNSEGICKPDMLHIGKNSPSHEGRIRTYKREIEELREPIKPKFKLESMEVILHENILRAQKIVTKDQIPWFEQHRHKSLENAQIEKQNIFLRLKRELA